jgi:hypothetical protein
MKRFEKGEKIEIENDFFIIGDRNRKSKYRELILLTKDPLINFSKLLFYPKKILLEIERKVDCQVQKKAIVINSKTYQIEHEKTSEKFSEENGWETIKIYELGGVGDRRFLREDVVFISENRAKERIYYSKQEINENEIIFNPEESIEKLSLGGKVKIVLKETIR